MRSIVFFCVIFFAFTIRGYGQKPSLADLFTPKMPTQIDTIYYPFYNGVQMIAVDHIAYWDRHIFFLEQAYPRAMPHSMEYPQPIGNEYFFRDRTGKIVKAYTTGMSLSDLTKHFKNVPIDKKNYNSRIFFPHHSADSIFAEGAWVYSPQSSFYFNGYYKVSNGIVGAAVSSSAITYPSKLSAGWKYGLIDSFGTIQVPILFEEILPLKNHLLASKNGKWGVIDFKQNIIVPQEFNTFSHYYSDQQYNDYIYFKKNDKYAAIFYCKENKLIAINNYDKIYWEEDIKEHPVIPVTRNGKMGFINSNFKEIAPPQYEISDFLNATELTRVARDGKFGFINKNAKEIIPCVYDYAEPFTENGLALVLKKGIFFCIDKKGNKQSECKLTPTCKYDSSRLPPGISRMEINTDYSSYSGLINTSTNEVIFPFNNTEINELGTLSEYYFSYTDKLSNKKGIINLQTLQKTACIYDRVESYYDDKIVASKNNKYGILDPGFQTIIDFKYEYLEIYSPNPRYLVFRKGNKEGLMDLAERILIPADKYDDIDPFLPYGLVKIGNRIGVLNAQAKEIIPCMYDDISNYDTNVQLIVRKGRKYGIVDMNNNEVLPIIYDEIHNKYASDSRAGYFHVVLNKEHIFIKDKQ